MQDESLIDEMREALKGDRERAETRRRETRPAARWTDPSATPDAEREPRPGLLARLALRRGKR